MLRVFFWAICVWDTPKYWFCLPHTANDYFRLMDTVKIRLCIAHTAHIKKKAGLHRKNLTLHRGISSLGGERGHGKMTTLPLVYYEAIFKS